MTHETLQNFVTSSISQAMVVFNKLLFLVKVCALHFKQLFASFTKRFISIAVYDWIAKRIERENRYENGLGQNYYVSNVSFTLKIGVQN